MYRIDAQAERQGRRERFTINSEIGTWGTLRRQGEEEKRSETPTRPDRIHETSGAGGQARHGERSAFNSFVLHRIQM